MVLKESYFLRAYSNSLLYCFFSIIGTLALCSMAAYEFALFDFPGKKMMFPVILLSLMVPTAVTLIPTYLLVARLGWLNTLHGLFLPGIASAFGLFMLTQFFKDIPKEIMDAAQIDGASHFGGFWHIVLPLSRNALITLAILTFMMTWGNFIWPMVAAKNAQSITVSQLINWYNDPNSFATVNSQMTAFLIAAVIPILVFIIFQRQIIQGISITGLKANLKGPYLMASIDLKPRILLGPGPSNVHPRVLQALSLPLVGYLDPQVVELMEQIQAMLRYLFQTENNLTFPVSGTGSAGMETALCNFIEPGDPVLVCVMGYFGERLAEIASRYGAQVRRIDRPWGEAFTPDEVKAALQENPARLVAMVQAETSTGVRQPMEGMAELVHAQGGLLVMDCVASLGGVPIQVDGWGVDIAFSGSQKCISVPPGLAPITVNQRAQANLAARRLKLPIGTWI